MLFRWLKVLTFRHLVFTVFGFASSGGEIGLELVSMTGQRFPGTVPLFPVSFSTAALNSRNFFENLAFGLHPITKDLARLVIDEGYKVTIAAVGSMAYGPQTSLWTSPRRSSALVPPSSGKG